MSEPAGERATEEGDRARDWMDRNVGQDRFGFVTVRPPTRPYALGGLLLGVLAVLVAGVSGSDAPLAVAYLLAVVAGGGVLVIGAVLFVAGWATGPKGVFAEHNRARRIGARLLLTAGGCVVLLAVTMLGNQVLAWLR